MFEFVIQSCSHEQVDHISDTLEELGALAITLTDQHDDPILEPELGTTPLWSNVVIHALFDDITLVHTAEKFLFTSHPQLESTVHTIADQEWERVCLDRFHPERFGERLWICPSWLPTPEPNAVNVILDPGLAFGTGSHQTTALCLEWLDSATLTEKHLIDYGCGSGILALAAAKLGVLRVDAVDIDPQALTATQANAATNAITTDQLRTYYPNELPATQANIIIANILLEPLLTLQTLFHQRLQPNGTLVVSGILKDQVHVLIDAYQTLFEPVQTRTREDWGLIEFKKMCD